MGRKHRTGPDKRNHLVLCAGEIWGPYDRLGAETVLAMMRSKHPNSRPRIETSTWLNPKKAERYLLKKAEAQ